MQIENVNLLKEFLTFLTQPKLMDCVSEWKRGVLGTFLYNIHFWLMNLGGGKMMKEKKKILKKI